MKLIPLKIKKIAVAHTKIPNPNTKGYKGFSLFLNELFIITGPMNNRGNAPDKYRAPLSNIFLLVDIIKK